MLDRRKCISYLFKYQRPDFIQIFIRHLVTLLSSLSSHRSPCFRHFRHIKLLAFVTFVTSSTLLSSADVSRAACLRAQTTHTPPRHNEQQHKKSKNSFITMAAISTDRPPLSTCPQTPPTRRSTLKTRSHRTTAPKSHHPTASLLLEQFFHG